MSQLYTKACRLQLIRGWSGGPKKEGYSSKSGYWLGTPGSTVLAYPLLRHGRGAGSLWVRVPM